jgi:hypothetical protein
MVTSTQPATLRIQANNGNVNGQPVADLVVNVTTTIGATSPSSGTTLTDANGIATIIIESAGITGAGTIQAAADAPAGQVTAQLSFEVGSPGLRLGHFDNGVFQEGQIGVDPDSSLVWQGTAQFTVDIVDENGDRVSSTESVTFSSECILSGSATLDPDGALQTQTGQVTTAYTSVDCENNDEITASLAESNAQATASLSIGSVQANRLIFSNADPLTIVLKGTGGTDTRKETSVVSFQVLDAENNPAEGIVVNFSLSTTIGGLSLNQLSDTSDAEGMVETSISAGDISTVVRVIATISDDSGTDLSTVSNLLTVTTGLSDQNSIGLGVEGGFVVENGMNIDGISRTVTVRMSDKFNNPVIDGTSAVFTTEYGTIDPSCITGVSNGERLGGTPQSGECSVMWTSGPPRVPTLADTQALIQRIDGPGYDCPSHNGSSGPCPNPLPPVRGGRSTILVTALGEESFIDRNGNGVMDEDEKDLFTNLPEAWIDHNEDGIYNPAVTACKNGSNSTACISGQEEIFVDFNTNGEYDLNNSPAVYNGLLCPIEGDGVWCSRSLVNVRASTVITMSNAAAGWGFNLVRQSNSTVTTTINENTDYIVYISDVFNNPPPAESTISVETTGACQLVTDNSFTVPVLFNNGAYAIPLRIEGDGISTTGTVTVTATSDGEPAVQGSRTYTCRATVPDPNAPGGGLVVGGG